MKWNPQRVSPSNKDKKNLFNFLPDNNVDSIEKRSRKTWNKAQTSQIP